MGAFLRLSRAERLLLARAVLVLAVVRLGLWLLPFESVRDRVAGVGATPGSLPGAGGPLVDRLAWAVAVAGRYVPHATCLAQALALQVLLRRAGIASTVHIGVAQDEAYGFHAHAWLEWQGRVLMGGSPSDFKPLLKWE